MTDMPCLRWPREKDSLFQEGKDWWNTAILSLADRRGHLLAPAFKQASDLLVSHVRTTQMDQDSLVYPIMFLYRQYLELTLKALILDGRSLLGLKGDYPSGHDIRKLWSEARSILEQVFPDEPAGDLDVVDKVVGQFMEVDPDSQAFRYPVDKKGRQISRRVIRVPLVNVASVMDGVANLLNGSIDVIDAYRQDTSEM